MLVSSGIDSELARRCIDIYIDAWNEPQLDRRRLLFAQVMADYGVYTDPVTQIHSRADLVDYVGDMHDKGPGRRVVRTSDVDVHHLVCRFNWRLIQADGTQRPESVDFVEFASDGRIRRVTGFFGYLSSSGTQ
jgi:hypothetical protein